MKAERPKNRKGLSWFVGVTAIMSSVWVGGGCGKPTTKHLDENGDIPDRYTYNAGPRKHFSAQIAGTFTRTGFCIIKYEWMPEFGEVWIGQVKGGKIVPLHRVEEKAFLQCNTDFLVEGQDYVDIYYCVDRHERRLAHYSKVQDQIEWVDEKPQQVLESRSDVSLSRDGEVIFPTRFGAIRIANRIRGEKLVIESISSAAGVSYVVPWASFSAAVVDGRFLMMDGPGAQEGSRHWYTIDLESLFRTKGKANVQQVTIQYPPSKRQDE